MKEGKIDRQQGKIDEVGGGKLCLKRYYKRRVSELIDRSETIVSMSKKIGETSTMTQKVFAGTKRSLRVEEKISSFLGGEIGYFFDCKGVRRRKVG